jgi:hypothetical protein
MNWQSMLYLATVSNALNEIRSLLLANEQNLLAGMFSNKN